MFLVVPVTGSGGRRSRVGGGSGMVTSRALCPPILPSAESVVLLVPVADDDDSVPLALLLGVPDDARPLVLLEIDEGEQEGLARLSVLLLLSGDSTLIPAPNPSKSSFVNLNSEPPGLVLGSIVLSTAPSNSATMSITLFLLPNM